MQEHVPTNVGEDIRQDYLSGYYGGMLGADIWGGGGSILPSAKSFRAAPTLTCMQALIIYSSFAL